MRTRYLSLFFAATALASLAFAPAAFAAPVGFQTIDVTVHDEGSSAVMMVTGTLAEETPLPAEVELAVPKGGEIQWSGEILGGDPAADPSVTPKVTTVGDHDIYTFTLTKSRIGQVEVVGPAFYAFQGTGYTGKLAWSPARDVPSLRLSVLVPTGGKVTTMSPGAQSLQGPQGATYIDKTFKNVKADDQVEIALAYAAAPVGASATPQSTDSTTPIIIILLIAAAGTVLFIFAINRKRQTRIVTESDDDDYGFSDESPTKSGSTSKAASRKTVAVAAPEPISPKRSKAALVITGVIIAVAVIAGVMAGQTSSNVTETPDGFVREFAQGDACSSVTLKLLKTPSKGDAEKMFDAVEGATPLRGVVYTENPRIEVGFCESSTTAEKVQSALAPTGLVGEVIPGAPAPTTP